ncbi:MAG TPA: hypothetical protein VFE24_13100 [Pirellulales bacterium]|nr:hypothetical protein [Pirellulales bacterium]
MLVRRCYQLFACGLALSLTSTPALAQRPSRATRADARSRPGQEPNRPSNNPQAPSEPEVNTPEELRKAVAAWERLLPRNMAELNKVNLADLSKAALEVDAWAGDLGLYDSDTPPADLLRSADLVLTTKAKVDAKVNELLAHRTELAALVKDPASRELARN